MNQELLALVGAALYGPLWQSELSRALKVSDRTMRRWAAGKFAVPPSVVPELLALIEQRADDLKAAKRALQKIAKP